MSGMIDFKERGVQVVVGGFVICVGAPIARIAGSDTAAAIILGVGMLTVIIGVAIMMISRRNA